MQQCVSLVLSLISSSLDAWRTRQYDYYQRVLNGILWVLLSVFVYMWILSSEKASECLLLSRMLLRDRSIASAPRIFLMFQAICQTIMQHVSITKRNCNYVRHVLLWKCIIWNVSGSILFLFFFFLALFSLIIRNRQDSGRYILINRRKSCILWRQFWTAHTVQWFLKEDWADTQSWLLGLHSLSIIDWLIQHTVSEFVCTFTYIL